MSAPSTNRPTVLADDDGIRPAGPPDECFYCRRKVGQQHGPECVVVTKRVKLRYIFEIEDEVPYHWTKEDIEFHRNESSWCATNSINDILQFGRLRDMANGVDPQDSDDPCLCNECTCEFVEVTRDIPKRRTRAEAAMEECEE